MDKGIGKQGVAKSDTPRRYLKAIPYSHLFVKDKIVGFPRPVIALIPDLKGSLCRMISLTDVGETPKHRACLVTLWKVKLAVPIVRMARIVANTLS